MNMLPHIKLRFNIEYPDLEDCYIEGYQSALAATDEKGNPFPIGTREHEQWLDGWWAGFYGEEPLFTLKNNSLTKKKPPVAANDQFYHVLGSMLTSEFFTKMLKITGALAATAVVGYQVFDLVA